MLYSLHGPIKDSSHIRRWAHRAYILQAFLRQLQLLWLAFSRASSRVFICPRIHGICKATGRVNLSQCRNPCIALGICTKINMLWWDTRKTGGHIKSKLRNGMYQAMHRLSTKPLDIPWIPSAKGGPWHQIVLSLLQANARQRCGSFVPAFSTQVYHLLIFRLWSTAWGCCLQICIRTVNAWFAFRPRLAHASTAFTLRPNLALASTACPTEDPEKLLQQLRIYQHLYAFVLLSHISFPNSEHVRNSTPQFSELKIRLSEAITSAPGWIIILHVGILKTRNPTKQTVS